MADHRAQVEELLADYRRSREQLASMHKALTAISESATSADGVVTAKVGPQGQLIDLVIQDSAYQRHRPAELARLVVATTAEAAARAAEAASRTIHPLLSTDADPAALLAGTADLRPEEIAPDQPAHPTVADVEESYENRSWLDYSERRRTSR